MDLGVLFAVILALIICECIILLALLCVLVVELPREQLFHGCAIFSEMCYCVSVVQIGTVDHLEELVGLLLLLVATLVYRADEVSLALAVLLLQRGGMLIAFVVSLLHVA